MLPSPPVNPPPWIHTMTGKPPRPVTAGVYTFRYRQFSDVLVVITPVATLPVWAQAGPIRSAFLMPFHRGAGCGGRHRRAPAGGAAYGMPKNSRTLRAYSPRTAPLSVRTTSGAGRAAAAAAAGRPAAAGLAAAAPLLRTRPATASPRLTARGSRRQNGRTTRCANAMTGSSLRGREQLLASSVGPFPDPRQPLADDVTNK